MRHSTPHAKAPIAPIALQTVTGSLGMLVRLMPPSAATGNRADRATRDQRAGPRALAPGWLAVAKTGERKTNAAPARVARRRSAGPWAELVVSLLPRRSRGRT